MSMEKLEHHYKASEAAYILGVTTETLRRWEKLGLLKARRLPSGHMRIPKSEVGRLLSFQPRLRVKAKRQK
jgi:excisionase family DNA binding protein